jgi:UDP-glucose 4-epimerase
MAKCLILGANGFIGSHLVDALALGGHSVRAFGRFKGQTAFNEHESIELFAGDFLNAGDLAEAVRGMEYVFHFISTTTPASAENDPLIDIETNIRMSVELLQICVSAGVKRVIFASTGGAIYGEGGDKPFSETDLPKPVSPYAIGKLSIEQYLRYFKVKHGLDSVALRISNPYGERQPLHRKQGVLPIFLDTILNDQPLTIYGDGSMVRDYVYVKDVATMIAAMFDKPAQHEVYNVGSGAGHSVLELVSAVEKASGKTAQLAYQPAPPTFISKVVLDTTRFSQEFGVGATTSLDDGLIETLRYIESETSQA